MSLKLREIIEFLVFLVDQYLPIPNTAGILRRKISPLAEQHIMCTN